MRFPQHRLPETQASASNTPDTPHPPQSFKDEVGFSCFLLFQILFSLAQKIK